MYFFLYRKGDVTVLVNSLVGVARAQHASVLYLINGILLLTLQWRKARNRLLADGDLLFLGEL